MSRTNRTPKLAPDLIWRTLDDDAIIVSPKVGKVRVLNGIGTSIWKLLAEGQQREEIEAALVDAYQTTPEQLRADIDRFFQELSERNLLVWDR